MSTLTRINKLTKEIKDIKSLKKFLIEFFDNDVEIYLVGSRAKGTNRISSDVDIVINSREDIKEKIAMAKFAIEESNLPQKVDIIYLPEAPYFKKIIEREGIRWK